MTCLYMNWMAILVSNDITEKIINRLKEELFNELCFAFIFSTSLCAAIFVLKFALFSGISPIKLYIIIITLFKCLMYLAQ